MLRSIRFISVLFAIIFLLAACNLPSRAPATEEPNAVFTAAALTVQAMSTQATPFNTPTIPPPPATNTAVSFPTLTRAPSTAAVPPTAACDLASFVKDMSIPDGSVFTPGATFTKTWRLENAGTCTWSGYSLLTRVVPALRADVVGPLHRLTARTLLDRNRGRCLVRVAGALLSLRCSALRDGHGSGRK